MTKKKPSAYKILGLSATDGFTKEDLKKAYRERAREHHPDRIHNEDPQKEAEEKQKAKVVFQQIKNAYEELQEECFGYTKNVYEESDDDDDEDIYEMYMYNREEQQLHLSDFMPDHMGLAETTPRTRVPKGNRRRWDEVDSDEERSLEAERRAEIQTYIACGREKPPNYIKRARGKYRASQYKEPTDPQLCRSLQK